MTKLELSLSGFSESQSKVVSVWEPQLCPSCLLWMGEGGRGVSSTKFCQIKLDFFAHPKEGKTALGVQR